MPVAESLTPNMEMYLKTIFEIDGTGGAARVKAIAERLGVTMPSVTGAVDTLQKKGLVEHTRYGSVRLTPRGKRVARDVKERNDLIHRFLLEVLRLPEPIAARDACVLEHVMSQKTMEQIAAFLEFTHTCGHGTPGLVAHFDAWLASGDESPQCPACRSSEPPN